GLDIALHSANLPREQYVRMHLHLQRRREQGRRIDVGITMNLSVAQEAAVLEAGNESQHARLFAKLQMVLKSDEVIGIRAEIFLPKLHDGIRRLAGSWVFESDRFHGTEA